MTKARLKRYRHIRAEIAQLQEEINDLRASLMSPSGKVITWAPTSPQQSDKFAGTIAAIDELESDYRTKLAKCIQLRLDIETAIESVDNELMRVVLRSRYIQCKTWEQICAQLNYSYSQIKRIHNKALDKMNHYEP